MSLISTCSDAGSYMIVSIYEFSSYKFMLVLDSHSMLAFSEFFSIKIY